jgi:hypothetical protein
MRDFHAFASLCIDSKCLIFRHLLRFG